MKEKAEKKRLRYDAAHMVAPTIGTEINYHSGDLDWYPLRASAMTQGNTDIDLPVYDFNSLLLPFDGKMQGHLRFDTQRDFTGLDAPTDRVQMMPAGNRGHLWIRGKCDVLAVLVPAVTINAAVSDFTEGRITRCNLVGLTLSHSQNPLLMGLMKEFGGLLFSYQKSDRLLVETMSANLSLLLTKLCSDKEILIDPTALPIGRKSIARVKEFVEDNLSASLSLDQLAGVACLSKYYFARVFRRQVGVTPHKYVVERRIARAAELLRRTDLPMSAIALETGFSSQAHLASTFQKHMRTTPLKYRRSFD